MLTIQYHCGCCNQVVASSDRDCPNCGSHNIISPYGLWFFCIVASIAVVVVFKMTQVYFSIPHEAPKTNSFVQVISHQHK